jgi:hypothetical protein
MIAGYAYNVLTRYVCVACKQRERDELETKVMKQDMELRNIQQIEERKYQVEIMRLKTEVEELKREQKKKQQIEPKGAMSEAAAVDVSSILLFSICVFSYICVRLIDD